jgi:hypothetical protein
LPQVQELVVGVATTHQQVQVAAAGIAAMQGLGAAAGEQAAAAAATSSAVAAVASVAPLAHDAVAAAAAEAAASVGREATAAAEPPWRQKRAAESAAPNADALSTAPEGFSNKRMKVLGCDRSD